MNGVDNITLELPPVSNSYRGVKSMLCQCSKVSLTLTKPMIKLHCWTKNS